MRRTPHARRSGGRAHRARVATLLAPALLVLLACAVYLNAVDNPFVYDDRDTVVANPSLADPSNLRFILAYSPFRPVVNISYAIDRAVWGRESIGFHRTNILLHGVAVVLLYFFVLRTLERARLRGAHSRERTLAAFTASAIFAVHPLMTEAVGYVSGRSEVLCAVWFLATLLLATRAMVSGGRLAAVGACISGALALASKETAAALPVVLLAYDWLFRPGTDDARRWRLRRVHVPVLALIAAAAIYRLVSLQGAAGGVGSGSALLDGLTQATVIWRYLWLLVWPVGQSIMHGVSRLASPADPVAWLALAGLLIIAGVGLSVRRTHPMVTFGLLWFFAVIAPSSSVIPLREVMAEHRVYLAVPGLLMVLAAAVPSVLGAFTWRGLPPVAAFGVVLCVLLAGLSTLTVRRNGVWDNPVNLWADAAARAPDMWEPHYALADARREGGDCAGAIVDYRKVLALRPAHRDAYINLGICLAESGALQEAEIAFHRAIDIDPAYVRSYTNLGALALLAGDVERARDYYSEAIERDPRSVLARMQLASLYERTFGDYHAAARMCGEARLIAPSTPGVVECVERNQRLAAAKDAGRQPDL